MAEVIDPISLLFSAIKFLLPAQQLSDWTPEAPPQDKCYLTVYDFCYEAGTPQTPVGSSVVGSFRDRTKLKDDLESLPAQGATFRVYIYEELSMDDDALSNHLSSRGILTGYARQRSAHDTFEALMSQWRETESIRNTDSISYKLTVYAFDDVRHMYEDEVPPTSRRAFLAGLIRMNMAIQIRDIAGIHGRSVSM
ncbi:hypothetical protein E8E13_002757 [Curvularia kusanoi]|uniref:Uncharacterized protein n=1 Tax=Curvularia kusanoi TaxID=90978 RepID=A0A9P4TF99_CURKU|nr:hypothetical protein E8E13_002757 [Curvularia kusanoi]